MTFWLDTHVGSHPSAHLAWQAPCLCAHFAHSPGVDEDAAAAFGSVKTRVRSGVHVHDDSHALVSPKEMLFQGRSIAKSLIIFTSVRMSEHVPRLTPCIPQYMSGTHETTSANIVKAKPIFTVLRPQRLPEAQLLACYRTASGHIATTHQ